MPFQGDHDSDPIDFPPLPWAWIWFAVAATLIATR